MSAFPGSPRKTLAAAALAAVLVASPAAAAPASGGSADWLRQAFGWLANPLEWMAVAVAGCTGTQPPGVSPQPQTADGPPEEDLDQGWSVDPLGGQPPR